MKSYFRKYFPVNVLFLPVVLIACTATPDLSGWAQNSAELAGAIGGENKLVSDRIEQDLVLVGVGEDQGWKISSNQDNPNGDPHHTSAIWKENLGTYRQGTAAISTAMDAMVNYANALSGLAAKGETGREASKSILDSMKSIAGTFGVTYPLSAFATALFQEIADDVTKVQAQDTLAETMQRLQPSVDKLADVIKYYAEKQRAIIYSVNNLEQTLYIEQAGPLRTKWYLANRGYKQAEYHFAQKDVSGAAAYVTLIQALQPRYEALQQASVASNTWIDDRLSALKKIEEVAQTWRDTHQKAQETLVACGGLRSLQLSCGNFTAANLKLAAERIRNIVNSPSTGTATPSPNAVPNTSH